MKKFGLVFLALSLAATAHAKKAAKPKVLSPVTVEIENGCDADLGLKIGDTELTLAKGAKSGAQTLQGREDQSYPLQFVSPQVADLGLLSLTPGGQYTVRLSDCRAGAADIYSESLSDLPEGQSPHAAAQVRYRARQNLAFEYASGKISPFKTLAVGMTSYQDVPAGEHPFKFRLRAAKKGPVLKLLTKTAELKAGRKYLIEANVVGSEILFKIEDEGFVDGKG